MLFEQLLHRYPLVVCILMNGSKLFKSKEGHLMVGNVQSVCGKLRSVINRFAWRSREQKVLACENCKRSEFYLINITIKKTSLFHVGYPLWLTLFN